MKSIKINLFVLALFIVNICFLNTNLVFAGEFEDITYWYEVDNVYLDNISENNTNIVWDGETSIDNISDYQIYDNKEVFRYIDYYPQETVDFAYDYYQNPENYGKENNSINFNNSTQGIYKQVYYENSPDSTIYKYQIYDVYGNIDSEISEKVYADSVIRYRNDLDSQGNLISNEYEKYYSTDNSVVGTNNYYENGNLKLEEYTKVDGTNVKYLQNNYSTDNLTYGLYTECNSDSSVSVEKELVNNEYYITKKEISYPDFSEEGYIQVQYLNK